MEPMTVGSAAPLATHLFATAATVGLIWFVQLVHSPLFDRVGRSGSAYSSRYQRTGR